MSDSKENRASVSSGISHSLKKYKNKNIIIITEKSYKKRLGFTVNAVHVDQTLLLQS